MKDIDKVKSAIVDSAARLFEQYGYEKTSIDDITSGVNMSKASVYYHFQGKLSIFKAVLRREMEAVCSKLKKIRDSYDSVSGEQLEEYLMARMNLLREARVYRRYALSLYMNGRSEVTEAVEEARKQLDDEEYGYYHMVGEEGVARKVFPEDVQPDAFAKMMILLHKGLEIQFYSKDSGSAMEKTYRAMLEILIFGNFNKNMMI